jgi:hypothetical protein
VKFMLGGILVLSLQGWAMSAGFPHAVQPTIPMAVAAAATSNDPSDAEWEAGNEWWTPCEDLWNDGRVACCEIRDYGLAATGDPVVVRPGPNGGVQIRGWDEDSIRVRVRVKGRAGTEEQARALAGRVRIVISGSRIVAEGPEARDGAWIAEFRIHVPRRSDVSVRTLNGPLHVEGVTGAMDLETVNGPLALIDLGGAIEAHTRNGPLSVVLGGSRWNGAGLEAMADNGPLSLTLPEDYSARLRTGTINGPVSLDHPFEAEFHSGKHARVTLGSGGPPVHVMTTNGPYSIQRRR